ncbi:GyrI-like domain-containing protein [Variovorax dokdonensis]|uniref:GyrI-like domain-containing protein n=1 Tax=Variovorax dokdonensis TaxID=344883 RepID=A0ABT7NEE1_9BURK|nr:GyrI-like domain-containing protein [Variovorax dokdonensis]MDM0046319.1 GyrI-like domain-containing protein [Variovorax dokdonensis]
MSPQIEHVESFFVAGLTERTCIAAELDPASSRIGPLWARFFDEDAYERPERTDDFRLFGVYTGYRLDQTTSFDITAGVAVTGGSPLVRIEGGEYLVFQGRGPMPALVHALWEQVDAFFELHPNLRRRYRSDFEAYTGPAEVALHIGVQRNAFAN